VPFRSRHGDPTLLPEGTRSLARLAVVALASFAVTITLVPTAPAAARSPDATLRAAPTTAGHARSEAPGESATEEREEEETGDEVDDRGEERATAELHPHLVHDWLPIQTASAVDAMHTHGEPERIDPNRLERPPRFTAA
jgi:hypothetical protein